MLWTQIALISWNDSSFHHISHPYLSLTRISLHSTLRGLLTLVYMSATLYSAAGMALFYFIKGTWRRARLWISILAMARGLKSLLSSPQASVTSLAWSCTYQPMRGIPQRATPRRTATHTAGVSTLVLCPLSWLKWWAFWPCTCSSTGTGSCGRARGPQITCRARLSRASPATGTATGAAPAPRPAPQTPRTPATPRRWAWRVSGLCPPPRSPCTHSPAGATP